MSAPLIIAISNNALLVLHSNSRIKQMPPQIIHILRFYLRDAVRAVLATATCLAGWVAGCPSHAGIVSKRLNLADNFFYHLKAPSFWFLGTPAPIQNSTGTPSARALNTRGWENWRFSCNFRRIPPFISETVRDRPMVTMEH